MDFEYRFPFNIPTLTLNWATVGDITRSLNFKFPDLRVEDWPWNYSCAQELFGSVHRNFGKWGYEFLFVD